MNSDRQTVEYEWAHVTDTAAFAPRDGAGALVYKGEMWLPGGWHCGDKVNFPRMCNNEVWSSGDDVNTAETDVLRLCRDPAFGMPGPFLLDV